MQTPTRRATPVNPIRELGLLLSEAEALIECATDFRLREDYHEALAPHLDKIVSLTKALHAINYDPPAVPVRGRPVLTAELA
jgi:hypothetical protein